MELNSLHQKRQNRTTCHLARSCQCVRFCFAPLNPDGPQLFQLLKEVGEIIMKYFNSAFMKFTVKDYTPKWQVLEIGNMMSCVISPLLFVLAMELILQGAANTSKGGMKNEHLTLPPSRAFMDDIIILVLSKITANGLLERYYDLFTWARMKAKPKKSRHLSLVRGSVREIHFKIGGDTIPKVRKKSVKSRTSLFNPTDWSS